MPLLRLILKCWLRRRRGSQQDRIMRGPIRQGTIFRCCKFGVLLLIPIASNPKSLATIAFRLCFIALDFSESASSQHRSSAIEWADQSDSLARQASGPTSFCSSSQSDFLFHLRTFWAHLFRWDVHGHSSLLCTGSDVGCKQNESPKPQKSLGTNRVMIVHHSTKQRRCFVDQ